MKKKFFTSICAIAFIFSFVLSFFGCGGKDIYIYVPDGPPLLAVASLYHNRPQAGNRRIRYEVTTGQLITSHIIARRPDFALAPINLAASSYNLTGDYVFGGVALWGMLHIVENTANGGGSPATALADLTGQVIYAYHPDLSPGIVLRTILAEAGLPINDNMPISGTPNPNAVNIVYLANNAAARDALMGNIAAAPNARFALLAEPVVSALNGIPDFQTAFDMQTEWQGLFGFSYPQVAIMVRTRLARDNSALVNEILDMIAQSVEFTRDNAAEAARIAVEELQSAYLPGRAVVESFIKGSGQEVFVFGGVNENRNIVEDFLGKLGVTVPNDGFFFN